MGAIAYHVMLSTILTYCVYYFFRDTFKTSFVLYGKRDDADVTAQQRAGIVLAFWICVLILSGFFFTVFFSLQYFSPRA